MKKLYKKYIVYIYIEIYILHIYIYNFEILCIKFIPKHTIKSQLLQYFYKQKFLRITTLCNSVFLTDFYDFFWVFLRYFMI